MLSLKLLVPRSAGVLAVLLLAFAARPVYAESVVLYSNLGADDSFGTGWISLTGHPSYTPPSSQSLAKWFMVTETAFVTSIDVALNHTWGART